MCNINQYKLKRKKKPSWFEMLIENQRVFNKPSILQLAEKHWKKIHVTKIIWKKKLG